MLEVFQLLDLHCALFDVNGVSKPERYNHDERAGDDAVHLDVSIYMASYRVVLLGTNYGE